MRILLLILIAALPALAQERTLRFVGGGNVGVPGDSYHTQTLALRFRTVVRTALPRTSDRLKPEILCSFHVPPPDGEGTFGLVRKNWSRREITFPAHFNAWADDAKCLDLFVRWSCLARLGFAPEDQERVPNNWVFAALVRRTATEEWNFRSSRFGRFPAAYAFASHGIFPALKDIVSSAPVASDGYARMVYEEWAQLLFDLCSRSGAIRDGRLELWLTDLIRNPEADRYALFERHILKNLEAYGKKRFGRFVMTGDSFDPDKWFRRETEKLLLSRFLPISLSYLETAYRQALRLPRKDGGTITIRELAETMEKGPLPLDSQLALSESIIRLTELAYTAPPLVFSPFSALVDEISQFRTSGKTETTVARLDAAEQKFLEALERQALTDMILKEAEQRHVPFGRRYTLSLHESASMAPVTDPAGEVLDRITRKAE